MLKTCAALAAGAALWGCAVFAPSDRGDRSALAFDLLGRVAVTYNGRAFSSSLRWEHLPDRDEIWLLTPTGQTLAYILAEASGATLTGADQQQYSAADVEGLTRRALGWELPLTRLAWWVRGTIVPGGVIGEVLRDEQGRLVRLRQDGWQITFVHAPAADPAGLPQRLELVRDAHHIRLVIDRWRQQESP
ncbi:MAG TPA: lipoprotein insertase outer membrane protein LolB [Burkholderiales bacterium]|nr:lipoprotein insertase outer membrane protein LolB [Burkholderiales bacterium]